MNRLGVLLGSTTRGNLVEALALSGRPLTSYRVAKSYNMNVAQVYIEMKRLARLGLVRGVKATRGVEYELVDDDLRRLVLKLSTRVVRYEDWRSNSAKRARFRSGFVDVPEILLALPRKSYETKPTRLPGEVDNLPALAKRRFEAKCGRKAPREYE